MNRLEDKVALVTGAASGLGKAIAKLFVQQGATVTITDIDEQTGQVVANEIGAKFLLQDVGNEATWEKIITDVTETSNGLHILVNNAGISNRAESNDPELTSFDSWSKVMHINAGGVFLGCKHAIPAIKQSGGGSIVNISSIAALVATPFLTSYGASKAAVCQFSKSVAIHCAEKGYGIRCNSVHPGQIMTPMLEGLFEDMGKEAGLSIEAMRSEFLKKIPLGDFGLPEEVASTVLFLASEKSSHITGQQFVIDGGMQYYA